MTFFRIWRAAFRKWFFGFPAVFHSVLVEPIFPPSGSFPWLSNVWRRLLASRLIDQRVVVAFERHPRPTMLAIRCLETFSVVFHVLCSSRQNCHFWIFLTAQSTVIYQEHAHRELRQAFDAILRQFSSNGNRKSMLSANRSFQAQNSTCSTLLQTMLLYETCIVLSRKCLSDVNKDFWHQ